MATGPVMLATAIDITPGTANTRTETDLAAYIPATATFAIIELTNARGGIGATQMGCWHPSSTTADQSLCDMLDYTHSYRTCPVASQKVDLYSEHINAGAIWLHGYIGDAGVQTLDGGYDGQDISEAATFGSWVEKDLSGYIAAPGVIALMEKWGVGARLNALRDGSSTDARTARTDTFAMVGFACGCTGQAVDGYAEDTNANVRLLGYVTAPMVAKANAPDISLGTTAVWQEDVDQSGNSDAAADCLFIEGYNNSSTGYKGQTRKPGSVDDQTLNSRLGSAQNIMLLTGAVTGTYDGWIASTDVDFYIMAYGVPAAPPAAGQPYISRVQGIAGMRTWGY